MGVQFPDVFQKLPQLTLAGAADILILSFILYYILLIFKRTHAFQILVGVALLLGAYYGALWGRLQTIQWLLDRIFPYLVFALIVVFQGDIRRALARIAHNPLSRRLTALQVREMSEDIVMAATAFSAQRTGALIVLERQTGLRTFSESGIPLNAHLSYDLLVAIFQHQSPMHDGAVIIRKDKVAAAACFLPLTITPIWGNQFGTRHRAAIGITEETDAIAVVVSEQTGAISLASGGNIQRDITADELGERLSQLLQRPSSTVPLPSVVPVASPKDRAEIPGIVAPEPDTQTTPRSEKVSTRDRI
jgi:diadenylate cyclase